jgi:hypothetical protein
MKKPVAMGNKKSNPAISRAEGYNPKTYMSKRRKKARSKLCLTWLCQYLEKHIAARPRVFDYQVVCDTTNNPPAVVEENNLIMETTLDLGWGQKT